MAGKSFAVFLQTDFDKPCRVRALSFYLRIPIGQTDLFQGTEQVKAIVEGSLDQRRIPNNLDTEDSNAALHPFFKGRFYKFNLSLANSQNLIKATANVILLSQI